MLRTPRRLAGILLATGALLAGAACSTGSTGASDAEPTTTSEADADAFPVTIEHSLGSATITEEPTRVVTLGSDADAALSLGVVPIAAEKVVWGGTDEGSTLWFDAALAEVEGAEAPQRFDTTDGTPTDDIIALEPDVVLATNSGITQEDFDALDAAGIPVVAYPGAMWTTTWQESLDLVGQALGRADLAGEVQAETEQAITDAVDAHPVVRGASFVFTWFDSNDLSTLGVYTAEDNRVRLLEEFGMVVPDHVREDSPEGAFYYDVSMENAADLTGDVMLTYADDQAQVEELTANPLVGQIPAVASGRVYADTTKTDSFGLSSPSPLSLPWVLENYLPKLAAVLEDQQ